MFTIEVKGLQELIIHLDQIGGGLKDRLTEVLQEETLSLEQAVRDRMAHLFRNPAEMQQSLSSTVSERDGELNATVSASGLPYLAILEFGGQTSPHSIFPRNAKVLAFMSPAMISPFRAGGQSTIFAAHIQHPGSRFPERSYMRAALALQKAQIIKHIKEVLVT